MSQADTVRLPPAAVIAALRDVDEHDLEQALSLVFERDDALTA